MSRKQLESKNVTKQSNITEENVNVVESDGKFIRLLMWVGSVYHNLKTHVSYLLNGSEGDFQSRVYAAILSIDSALQLKEAVNHGEYSANEVLVASLDSAIQEGEGAEELTDIYLHFQTIFPSLRPRDALLTEVKDVPLALWAVQSGDLEIVMWFEYLAEIENINFLTIEDKSGFSTIDYMVSANNLKLLVYFLQKYFNSDPVQLCKLINRRGYNFICSAQQSNEDNIIEGLAKLSENTRLACFLVTAKVSRGNISKLWLKLFSEFEVDSDLLTKVARSPTTGNVLKLVLKSNFFEEKTEEQIHETWDTFSRHCPDVRIEDLSSVDADDFLPMFDTLGRDNSSYFMWLKKVVYKSDASTLKALRDKSGIGVLHYAVKGDSVKLFLHLFRELYNNDWREALLACSHKGYNCVALAIQANKIKITTLLKINPYDIRKELLFSVISADDIEVFKKAARDLLLPSEVSVQLASFVNYDEDPELHDSSSNGLDHDLFKAIGSFGAVRIEKELYQWASTLQPWGMIPWIGIPLRYFYDELNRNYFYQNYLSLMHRRVDLVLPDMSSEIKPTYSLSKHDINSILTTKLEYPDKSVYSSKVKSLTLTYNKLDQASLVGVMQYAKDNFPNLSTLTITNTAGGERYPICLSASALEEICTLISKRGSSIKEIKFSQIKIRESDLTALNSAVQLRSAPLTIDFGDEPIVNKPYKKLQQSLFDLKQHSELFNDRLETSKNPCIKKIVKLFNMVCAQGGESASLESKADESPVYIIDDSARLSEIIILLHDILEYLSVTLIPSQDCLDRINNKKTGDHLSGDDEKRLTYLEEYQLKASALHQALSSIELPEQFDSIDCKYKAIRNLYEAYVKFVHTQEPGKMPASMLALATIFYRIDRQCFFGSDSEGIESKSKVEFGDVFKQIATRRFKECVVIVNSKKNFIVNFKIKQTHESILDYTVSAFKFGAYMALAALATPVIGATVAAVDACDKVNDGQYTSTFFHSIHQAVQDQLNDKPGFYDKKKAALGAATMCAGSLAAGGLSKLSLGERILNVKFFSTEQWYQNFYNTFNDYEGMKGYVDCFLKAFKERYSDQIKLLDDPRQMSILEKSIWGHIEVALRLGLFKRDVGDDFMQYISPEEFTQYALDWLAYVPMHEPPIIPGVNLNGIRCNLSVDEILRAPGIKFKEECSGNEEKIHWEDSNYKPSEYFKKYFWKQKVEYRCRPNPSRLGYRKASQKEAEFMQSQISNGIHASPMFDIKFHGNEIVSFPCVSKGLETLRDRLHGRKFKFTGQLVGVKSAEVEKDFIVQPVETEKDFNAQPELDVLRNKVTYLEKANTELSNVVSYLENRIEKLECKQCDVDASISASDKQVLMQNQLEEKLEKFGLKRRIIPGDGHCLFRSLGEHVGVGPLELRDQIGKYQLDHMREFLPFFRGAVAEFKAYVQKIRTTRLWGGDSEILAFQKIYQRPVVLIYERNILPRLYCDLPNLKGDPIFLYHSSLSGEDKMNANHYDILEVQLGHNAKDILKYTEGVRGRGNNLLSDSENKSRRLTLKSKLFPYSGQCMFKSSVPKGNIAEKAGSEKNLFRV